MKQHPPFFRLLKNELSITNRMGWVGLLVIPIYVAYSSALPATCFYIPIAKTWPGDMDVLFGSGIFGIMAFIFISQTLAWTAFSNIPALSEWLVVEGNLTDSGRYEFLFTRALDRKRFFRAKTISVLFLAVSPTYFWAIYINLAPWEQSHAILADWLALGSTLVLILLQSYCVLVARLVKPNKWWTVLIPFAPVLFLLGAMQLMWHVGNIAGINLYQRSYLLFASHPFLWTAATAPIAAIVQTWCERRFAKLEI